MTRLPKNRGRGSGIWSGSRGEVGLSASQVALATCLQMDGTRVGLSRRTCKVPGTCHSGIDNSSKCAILALKPGKIGPYSNKLAEATV